MSKMRIHNPVTGEVIEHRIPLRWTPQAKRLMIAGVVCLLFFAYFAQEFYSNDWQILGSLMSACIGSTAMLMYKLYKAIRTWSDVYAHQQYMRAVENFIIAESSSARRQDEEVGK